MRRIVRFLLLVAILSLVQSCVVADQDQWARCDRDARLQVVDLDISPDPIAEGQPIRELKVRLQADGRTRCETVLEVRERSGNDLVGRERVYRLREGVNQIEFEPSQRYRFTRDEHCFVVVANIEGNFRPVDAQRRFCARQVGGRRWTLRN
jgi:hypothetical protein